MGRRLIVLPPAVVANYAAGRVGLIGAAKTAGCSTNGVRNALARAGVTIRPVGLPPGRCPLAPLTAGQGARYRNGSATLRDLARERGVCIASVRKLLLASGVSVRGMGPRPPTAKVLAVRQKRRRRLLALRKQGLTLKEIGRREGVSWERVRQILAGR